MDETFEKTFEKILDLIEKKDIKSVNHKLTKGTKTAKRQNTKGIKSVERQNTVDERQSTITQDKRNEKKNEKFHRGPSSDEEHMPFGNLRDIMADSPVVQKQESTKHEKFADRRQDNTKQKEDNYPSGQSSLYVGASSSDAKNMNSRLAPRI